MLHWPNWRKLEDIKKDPSTWCEILTDFLNSNHCPNFVKADIEKAKLKTNPEEPISDDDDDPPFEKNSQEPEWLDLVRPVTTFEDSCEDFQFDDGGLDHDWSKSDIQYPQDLGTKFLQKN